jgi:murein tripeptide amidase MpaA
MDSLSKDFPKNISVITFGKSFENRELKAIKMVANETLKKRVVVFDCGIHAREWISPAFCMWTIDRLLTNSSLLEIYDFLIVPVLNPDGYVLATDLELKLMKRFTAMTTLGYRLTNRKVISKVMNCSAFGGKTDRH